jgi:hypothetical protein
MNRIFAIIACLSAVALCACDETKDMVYRPYPQILPQHVKKLAVRPFVNKTQQFGIEDKFNLQLLQQFQSDGTYPISSENDAEGVITGEIWRYLLTPIQYNSNQVTTAYKLTVQFHVKLIDSKTNQILWDEPAMVGNQIYSDASLPGGMTELQAQQAIWERVAQDIVTRTISGFGSVSSQSQKYIIGGPQDQQVAPSTAPASAQ